MDFTKITEQEIKGLWSDLLKVGRNRFGFITVSQKEGPKRRNEDSRKKNEARQPEQGPGREGTTGNNKRDPLPPTLQRYHNWCLTCGARIRKVDRWCGLEEVSSKA